MTNRQAANDTALRDATERVYAGKTFSAFVRGTPAPKGNMSGTTRGGFVKLYEKKGKRGGAKQWQSDVARMLQDRWAGAPWEGPIKVELAFQMLRPASVSAKRRPYMTVKPDIDKLARCVLDAMTGICFRDDAQVTSMTVLKRYDLEMGVHVTVQDRSA